MSVGKNYLFLVGSCTEVLGHVPNGCGEGVSFWEFDSNRMKFQRVEGGVINPDITPSLKTERGLMAPINNPSWVEYNPNTKLLLAVQENGELNPGDLLVTAPLEISRSEESGAVVLNFTENFKYSSTLGGLANCHIASRISGSSLQVAVAAYVSGSVWVGTPGQTGKRLSLSGKGPNTARQEAAHAHHAAFIKGSLFICDLGSDKVWSHACPEDPNDTTVKVGLAVTPGYGPRHLTTLKDQSLIFVQCELQPKLLVCTLNTAAEEKGSPELVQLEEHDTNSLPVFGEQKANADKEPSPSAIKLDPEEKFLYVSNRFTDTIAVFKINNRSNTTSSSGSPILSPVGAFYCGGLTCRDFTFTSDGDFMLAAHQDSNTLSVFKMKKNSSSEEGGNSSSGMPEGLGQLMMTENVPTATCLQHIDV